MRLSTTPLFVLPINPDSETDRERKQTIPGKHSGKVFIHCWDDDHDITEGGEKKIGDASLIIMSQSNKS